MTYGDWILICVAGYVAIVALVRLMRARRDQMVAQLRNEVQEKH